MREPPDIPVPNVNPQVRPGYVTEVREYELITPLYGGGVEPTKADPVTVIRGAEIRGHLRFWWRACRGGLSGGSIDRLRELEQGIWGMAAGPDGPVASKVNLRLQIVKQGVSKSWRDYERDLKYALFPLESVGGGQSRLVEDVRFRIELTYPTHNAPDVQAALWAWETLGGLGARTRRGLGALRCISIDEKPVRRPQGKRGLDGFIRDKLRSHTAAGLWPSGVPYLQRGLAYKITGPHSDTRAAWAHLIDKLSRFRQQRDRPRGHSLWPEAETIRSMIGTPPPGGGFPTPRLPRFPRAHLGLPIVFQFPTDPSVCSTPTLQTAHYNRMASPLLLRPISTGRTEACGLALILDGAQLPPDQLVLADRGAVYPVRADMNPSDRRVTDLNTPWGGNPDILRAFLATL